MKDTETLQTKDKRFLRLGLFLEPHTNIELELDDSLMEPLEMKEKKSQTSKRLKVKVSPLVLKADAPEWVEKEIAALAIGGLRKLRASEETLFEMPAELVAVFEKEKANRSNTDALSPEESLVALWQELAREYFPDNTQVKKVTVRYAKRNRSMPTPVHCDFKKNTAEFSPRLNSKETLKFIPALAYKAMCGFVLKEESDTEVRAVEKRSEFSSLERRHPGTQEVQAWIASGAWAEESVGE